jgi:hypothetical protein
MTVAVIEISGQPDSRSGTRRDGSAWGPFWSQKAYVHGSGGRYPTELTFGLSDERDGFQPGFYLVDGSALQMQQPSDGKGSAYPSIRLGNRKALIPLNEGLKQLGEFQKQSGLAAAA